MAAAVIKAAMRFRIERRGPASGTWGQEPLLTIQWLFWGES